MIDRTNLSKLALKFRDLNKGDFFTTTPSKVYNLMNPESRQMSVWRKKDYMYAVTMGIRNNTIKETGCPAPFKKNEKVIPLSL